MIEGEIDNDSGEPPPFRAYEFLAVEEFIMGIGKYVDFTMSDNPLHYLGSVLVAYGTLHEIPQQIAYNRFVCLLSQIYVRKIVHVYPYSTGLLPPSALNRQLY